MKITKLECVKCEDYLAHLAARIEAAHTVSGSGRRRGGTRVIAGQYGVPPQVLANAMNGYGKPTQRMLEHDGLEAVTVYVRKHQPQGK